MGQEIRNYIRGVSEIGFIDVNTQQKVPFGKTTEDGVTWDLTQNTIEVNSGQSDVLEDELPSSVGHNFTFTLISGRLQNFARALGLPEDALQGDLGNDIDEVLTIAQNAMGDAPARTWYIETPGAGAGPREYRIMRGKVFANGSVQFQRDDILRVPMRLRALALQGAEDPLNPDGGTDVIRITESADGPATP